MTDERIIDRLTDVEALALTAMGEARGDSREGGSSIEERLAVMLVIRNRVQLGKWGLGIKGVCFRPKQFSCWLEGDPNRATLLKLAEPLVVGVALSSLHPLLRETLYLAEGVQTGEFIDTTKGATHYFSPAAMKPAGSVPAWAVGVEPCARVGGEVFYRSV